MANFGKQVKSSMGKSGKSQAPKRVTDSKNTVVNAGGPKATPPKPAQSPYRPGPIRPSK